MYIVFQLQFLWKDVSKIEVSACCVPLVSFDVPRDTANYNIYSCSRILFKHGMRNKKRKEKK